MSEEGSATCIEVTAIHGRFGHLLRANLTVSEPGHQRYLPRQDPVSIVRTLAAVLGVRVDVIPVRAPWWSRVGWRVRYWVRRKL